MTNPMKSTDAFRVVADRFLDGSPSGVMHLP